MTNVFSLLLLCGSSPTSCQWLKLIIPAKTVPSLVACSALGPKYSGSSHSLQFNEALAVYSDGSFPFGRPGPLTLQGLQLWRREAQIPWGSHWECWEVGALQLPTLGSQIHVLFPCWNLYKSYRYLDLISSPAWDTITLKNWNPEKLMKLSKVTQDGWDEDPTLLQPHPVLLPYAMPPSMLLYGGHGMLNYLGDLYHNKREGQGGSKRMHFLGLN